ncbi:hypothetical protein ACPOL_3038 [Acidisarcina polymorpha]|uniref:Uncharacterized protein n=1 Tax=Acidisarcina polymorpha TaxID=2211140 RepID=A0A2Z5G0U7_9BACT|nr:hypothetical protein ACPOL_2810 [Acidisarcina polymorpha]AXC12131.1 hypothetical protein ACPOL_2823 [Acidisarcina polymorpha]AXC12337.1 hypothetical protein ACPOL_3038 [Acidisarcina polymorpha]
MNLQPHPRIGLVPHHPCLSYATTNTQGHSSRTTDRCTHRPTLFGGHPLPPQELPKHQDHQVHPCHKRLKPIQLP